MKRRILFTVITLFLVVLYTQAQDRVNSESYYLHSKSKELKNAKFWVKSSLGKWKSQKNNTLDYNQEDYDNFLSLYFGITEYRGERKIIFHKILWKGHYKYPNLNLGWTNRKSIEAFIVSSEQYEKLKNIQHGETVELTSAYLNGRRIDDSSYNKSDFLHKLLLSEYKDQLGDRMTNTMETVFVAQRTTSEGKDVVRFKFRYRGYSHVKREKKIELDNYYFEVPKKDFDKLFQFK